MKDSKWRLWGLVAVMSVTLTMSACSKDGEKDAASDAPKDSAASATAPAATTTVASAAPVVEDGPLVKYDPAIEVSTVRMQNSGLKFPSGENWDNNIYTRELEKQLGIKV